MTAPAPAEGGSVPQDLTSLSDEELFELHRQQRNRKVRNTLVERHMGFAYYLAGQFQGRGQEREDLNQVALGALVKSVDRFDPTRGVPFSSFAGITIEGTLRRHFRDFSNSIRIPRSTKELSHKIRHAVGRLEQEFGRSPTPDEVAFELDVPVEDVLRSMAAEGARHPDSLDASMGPDGFSLASVLGAEDPEMGRAESRMTVSALLELLNERERLVVELRFFEDLPQVAIAERIGVSQMQISRILRRAVQRLRDFTADAVTVPETPAGPVVSDVFAMPADAGQLGPARDDYRTWLDRNGVSPQDAEDLLLIWSELVTNALHQQPERPILIEATVWEQAPQIRLTVVNDDLSGVELPPRASWTPDDPLAPRGRGLMIVDQLCQSVEWVNRNNRTTVTARFTPAKPVGVLASSV